MHFFWKWFFANVKIYLKNLNSRHLRHFLRFYFSCYQKEKINDTLSSHILLSLQPSIPELILKKTSSSECLRPLKYWVSIFSKIMKFPPFIYRYIIKTKPKVRRPLGMGHHRDPFPIPPLINTLFWLHGHIYFLYLFRKL